MATAVQIQITVDSKQSQAALDALKKGLQDAGVEGEVAFKKAGQGAQQMGGHINTGLDAVRLVSQEFGLRLPRAIEAMLSRMPGVTNALSTMLGLFAGIAGSEVFVHLGEEGYKLYNQYISLNAEADKFYETLKKTAAEDFSQTRSLETTRRRTDLSTQNATALPQIAQTMQGAGLSQLMQGNLMASMVLILGAHDTAEMGTQAQSDMVKLGKVQLDQTHEQALAQINANHALDGALVGQQKINAELAKKKQISAENREFDRKVEMYYGNPSPGNAGADKQRIADQTAQGEATAQSIVLGRAATLQMMKAHDEMVQANLQGDELYARRFADIERETTLAMQNEGKGQQEIHAAVLAAQAKLDAEYADKWIEKQRSVQELAATSRAAGLSGAARIAADHDNQLNRINTDRSLDPDQAAAQRVAAQTEMQQKLTELQDQFRETTLANVRARADGEVSGFMRIDAEGAKAYSDLQRAYDKAFKDDQGRDLGSGADQAALAAARAQIGQRTQAEKNQLTAANNAEDLQYAQEAARAEARVKEDGIDGWVARYKNASAEIYAEDVRRTAKMEEEARKQGLSDQEVAQRKADIDRTANAQIEEQNQQMQHQIAGTLQEAFTHPVDFIKSAMEKMFFEIVAGWIMHLQLFKNVFGGTMAGLQPGGGAGGAAGIGGAVGSVLRGAAGGAQAANGPAASSTAAAGGGGFSGGSGTASIATGVSGGSAIGSTLSGVSSLAQTLGLGTGGSGTASIAAQTDTTPAAGALNTPDGGSMNPEYDASQGADIAGSTSWLSQNGAGALTAAAGGYNAFEGTVNAFKSGNPLTGALADGAEGAAIGSIVPGVGTLVGGAIGAAIGAGAGLAGLVSGMGGNLSARDYYNKQIFPQLNGLVSRPNGDFQTEISDANTIANGALMYMGTHFGVGAANWVNDNYMKKELTKVVTTIADTAKGGRQFTTMSAAQFHSGGTITGFGDLATSGNEGFIHAMMGEKVMNPMASSTHGALLDAINSGASAADIAGKYLAASSPMGGGASPGANGDLHLHVHTLDTKTMSGWLKSGGAQLITKHQNDYNSQYAGDGISG